ncbi:hypothetical protein [Legionella sp.]|uniref:hypothetical protein n=1 Tax=Legionella sp. TaxID=459 RepID=UPI00325B5A8D
MQTSSIRDDGAVKISCDVFNICFFYALPTNGGGVAAALVNSMHTASAYAYACYDVCTSQQNSWL